MWKKGIELFIAAIAAVPVVCFGDMELHAQEKACKEVISVAFPEAEGFSQTDDTGRRSGITYDFLEEIAKYTGWEYEYIGGTPEDLVDGIMAGDTDIMGGMYRLEELEEYFYYPDYSMGSNYSLLLSRKDNDSIKAYNLETLNGKTIGVYSRATNRIERLEKYLDYNGVNCHIVYFDDQSEYENCLETGTTDLMLGSDVNKRDEYNTIGKFSGEYNYFAVSRTADGSKDIVNRLNDALKNIYEANPDFANDLYRKHFPNSYINSIDLSEKDKAYIEDCDVIRVAVNKDRYPLNFTYHESEQGIVRDVLALVTERTGLAFEFVYGDSYQEIINLVQEGKADVIGHFMDDDETAAELGLSATKPYTEMNEIIVKNKNVEYPKDGLTIVVPNGKGLPENVNIGRVIYVDTFDDCIRKVNKGEGDFTSIPFFFTEDIFHKENISNVAIIAVSDSQVNISLAMPRGASMELYSILSKAINNISDEEMNHIITGNQISMQEDSITLRSLINAYPELVIIISVLFIALIAAIILISWRARMRNELMIGELKQAETASEAKSDFLSRMSHDLRTPMNAIIGLTRLIQTTGETTPSIDEKLKKIDASSKYLLSLLNDILDMSKIENCKLKILVSPFRMNKLVMQLEYMISLQLEEKAVIFECFCDTEHEVFTGDEVRIKQVLMNLLSNAIKFTDSKGRVTLRITEQKTEEDQVLVHFSVQDTGIGIREENFKKIFESFEQINEKGNSVEGTGLGLSICSNLVRLMGGELQLQSEPGKGTEFYFTLALPAGDEQQTGGDSTADELPGIRESKWDETELKGLRLLLAEDNELNAEIITTLLEQKGTQIEHVRNGREAVEQFEQHPAYYYNAVLMDIQMPILNGLDAAKAIRGSEKQDAGQIPIIAMTANTFREDREQAMEAGMNGFVPKPFEMEELYRVFGKLIRNKE